jgi:LPS-assembly protein
VYYPDQATTFSNLIGDMSAALTDRWWVDVGGQYNPYDNQFERRQISLRYDARNNDLLNLTYLYLNQPSNQDFQVNLLDGSMRLPIPFLGDGWHAIGRWKYSLLDQITLEAFGGIERETCCWRLGVVARHYINSVNGVSGTDSFTSTANNGVFVQFEFKGLTRLGDQLEKLLTRSIRGYRTPDQ